MFAEIQKLLKSTSPDNQWVAMNIVVEGLGDKGIDFALTALETDFPFVNATDDEPEKSMVDFCERHDPSILNKTALDALCKTGAFDCLGSTRKGAFGSIELVLRSSAQAREDRRRGQGSLFAMPDDRHCSPETAHLTLTLLLTWNSG